MKYTERVLKKFLSENRERDKPWCCFIDGRLVRGIESTQLTRSGVRFNRLLRLRRRLGGGI